MENKPQYLFVTSLKNGFTEVILFCITARDIGKGKMHKLLPFISISLSDDISLHIYKKGDSNKIFFSIDIIIITTMTSSFFINSTNIHIANINYLNTLVKRIRQFDYWIFFSFISLIFILTHLLRTTTIIDIYKNSSQYEFKILSNFILQISLFFLFSYYHSLKHI